MITTATPMADSSDAWIIDEDAVLHDNGRVAPRHRMGLQAAVTAPDGVTRTFLVDDVSTLGVFVRTARPFAPGQRVRLSFALPRSPMMRIEGVVAWNTDERTGANQNPSRRGMGIRFTHVPPDAQAIIARYFGGARANR